MGDLKEGITRDYSSNLYKIENSNLCRTCDAYQCKNCVDINRRTTNEVNVSPSFQCRKSFIEKEISQDLLSRIDISVYKTPLEVEMEELKTLDPVNRFIKNKNVLSGYYKAKL